MSVLTPKADIRRLKQYAVFIDARV